ncbi:HtaA domain-containing protein [Nocardioides carbamazepini]|uniref:HtaA domain-containing protein n=1 Tax=Nocardioides carbamazepini TaxID=2854259 RepID=UPI00214A7A88|nr:HtaA domain-containing protein [Nocardioides carbamazepini]MCR1784278.1 HtaA domain-containing protein [Nocardioides carbamazepini]
MTSSSTGWRVRARPPLLVLTLLSLLFPALLLTAPPTRAADGEDSTVAVTDGTVVWGVRASFRNYIGTENITLSDGLTRNADGEFVFDIEDGDYDTDTKRLHLDLAGAVRFYGHDGALDMTIADLEVVIDGEQPAIFAQVTSRGHDGELVDYGRVPVVDLLIEGNPPQVSDGRTLWSGLPTALAEAAAAAFAGFYQPGSAMDPVTIDYAGPGGAPAFTGETVVSSGAPQYEPAGEIDGLSSVSNVVADAERGVVHVQHVPAGATSAVLQAYDYATLAPLAGAPIGAANQGYPGMFLDPGTGDVLMPQGADLVAYRRDPQGGYVSRVVSPGVGTVHEVTFDAPRDRFVVIGGGGLSVLTRSTTEASGFTITTYTGVSFAARESVVVVSANLVITTVAHVQTGARAIRLVAGTLTLTATPVGGVTDEKAVQPGQFDQPTMAFRDSMGIWLSAYTGSKLRVASSGGVYQGTGPWVQAGVGSFLADRREHLTDSVAMFDYSGRRVRVWKGDGWTDISVPGLGSASYFNNLGGDIGTDQSVFVGSTTDDDRVLKFRLTGLAPTATFSPADQTVGLGDGVTGKDVTLTAGFEDADSVRWQTRVGGTGRFADVPGATGTSLTWPATSDDNGRQFRVLATNEHATSTSATASLNVEFFPRVVAQPDDVTANPGDDALFKVMPAGNPYPSVTWQRRVGGFWQGIDPEDENFVVDGGFLTVRDTNPDQSGVRLRARLANSLGVVHTRAVALTVAEPSTVRREVRGGTLTWGVKKSFRDYLAGPIAHGSVTVSDGVTQNADGTFAFPVTGGWTDPGTGTAEVRLGGTVRFTGHDGPPTCAAEHSPCLALTISNPVLRITGGTAVLVADVESKDETTHAIVAHPGVALADVDATGWTAAGDRILATALPASLTEPGAAAFAGFYEAGAALDPITLDGVLGAEITDPVVTPPPVAGKAAVELDWRFKKAKVRTGKRAVIRLDARLVGATGAYPTGQVVVREGGKVRATARLTLDRQGRLKIRLPHLAKGRHFLRLELPGNAAQEPTQTAFKKLVVR